MSDFYQHLRECVTFAGVWSYGYYTHRHLGSQFADGTLTLPEYKALTEELANDVQRRADEITRLFHTPEVQLGTQDGRTSS